MTIESAIIIILAIDIFLILTARKVILRPAKKLNKVIRELRNNG